ncbi:hypothetical protein JCM3774_004862 [Rhodotorula dairenensis]
MALNSQGGQPRSPSLALPRDPPSADMDGTTSAQGSLDPQQAWGGRLPEPTSFDELARRLDPDGVDGSSQASIRSARSAARRQEAGRQLADERQRLLNEVEARMAAQQVKMEAELEAASAASVQGPEGSPIGLSATEAVPGVLARKMDDLRADYARFAGLYRARTGTSPAPLVAFLPSPIPVPLAPARFSPLDTPPPVGIIPKEAEVSTRHKLKEPKQWTGAFSETERESWIRTATLWLEYLGIGLYDTITPRTTTNATARYAIRALFSPERHGDAVSPQQWFDNRDDRGAFVTARDVFVAVQAHWCDDGAVERAWVRYRSAKQGSFSARAFGAHVDALANSITDRLVDDLDRRSQYIANLNDEFKRHVLSHLPREERVARLEGRVVTFDDVVRLAGELDSLALSKPAKPATSTSSSSFAKKSAGTDGFSGRQGFSSTSASSTSGPPRLSTGWAQAAKDWQDKNPVGAKPVKPNTSKPPDSLHCYNCGARGQHFVSACPNPRRDPRSVIVAALGLDFSSLALDPVPSGAGEASPSPSLSGNAAGVEE